MTASSVLLVAAGMLCAFGLSATQAAIASRAGSDHPVHAFLRDGIRRNGGRLFVTVPRLLNRAHCAALPLYLHWILARLPVAVIRPSERLLNPTVNALHAALVAIVATALAPRDAAAAGVGPWTAVLFALTPQFFHATSARNFGLSARGTGLLLLTALFACCHQAATSLATLPWWIAAALCAWLVWGFSTFAQQALVLIAVFMLAGGYWQPFAAGAAGLALFVAVHPRYATSYLRHTLRFQRAYARELAPIYVLQRRPGVWRDLVRDIWRKPRELGWQRAVLYAYENPVVVVALTNPLTWLAAGAWFAGGHPADWLGYPAALTLSGLAAFALTSFRPTRFLGEPERYVEVVTPWATLVAMPLLMDLGGQTAVAATAAAFLGMDLLQLRASHLLMRHVGTVTDELERIAAVVQAALGEQVRFCSNNEQLTKLLMGQPWQFAYFIAVGQDYAGMTATQAFSRFPLLEPTACARVAATYRVNCLLLDRNVYETVFDAPPAGLAGTTTLYESARFRLLHLRWT